MDSDHLNCDIACDGRLCIENMAYEITLGSVKVKPVVSQPKWKVSVVVSRFTVVPLLSQAFEDDIRKNRTVMSNWLKYSSWEEGQKEVQRWDTPGLVLWFFSSSSTLYPGVLFLSSVQYLTF